MTLAPQIAFRNMDVSPTLEEAVLKEAEKLERFFPRIMSCRVAIEGPSRHEHEHGGLYRVRIDLGVPGEELLVEQNPSLHSNLQDEEAMKATKRSEPNRERRDAQRAIHEAFHEMRRRLQDYVRRMEPHAKKREGLSSGKVTKLFPDEGYGFIEAEGREVYFHSNSVLDGHFNRLQIGTVVRFAEEVGEQGPQASSVKLTRTAPAGRKAAPSVRVAGRNAKA